jgi:tetratricopeptide (TPR) repeat protein
MMDDRQLNQQAQALHREARYLGQSGNYDGALEKLAEAMRLEPDWPYPVYDMAFTYLLRGDTAHALAYYNKTDELAPRGFFTTKTAIYALQGELMGKFPGGIYMAYMQIEWTDDTDMKIAIAQSIAEKVPEFAPAWKVLGSQLNDPEARLSAIEKGLSLDPDLETRGDLMINKALVFYLVGRDAEARKLLNTLISDEEASMINQEKASFVMRTMEEEGGRV